MKCELVVQSLERDTDDTTLMSSFIKPTYEAGGHKQTGSNLLGEEEQ